MRAVRVHQPGGADAVIVCTWQDVVAETRRLTAGTLRVRIGGEYALADAARAPEALEAWRTIGDVLLRPA